MSPVKVRRRNHLPVNQSRRRHPRRSNTEASSVTNGDSSSRSGWRNGWRFDHTRAVNGRCRNFRSSTRSRYLHLGVQYRRGSPSISSSQYRQ